MARILLTGASSFTGLWIAEALAAAGYEVVAPLTRDADAYPGLRGERVARLAGSAARVFAEQIKKYPKSPRGADSMLRMGQALAAQGQTRNACTAFAAIRKQYPDASPSTVTAVANARRAANCA